MMLPLPSHCFCWQSPVTCWAAGSGPAGAPPKPHTPALHLGTWQAVPLGHSESCVQVTQLPAPSHREPPIWLQALPALVNGWTGVPALHASLVHWLLSSAGTSVLSTALTRRPPVPS